MTYFSHRTLKTVHHTDWQIKVTKPFVPGDIAVFLLKPKYKASVYKIYLKRYALKNYNLLVLHLAKVKIACLPSWYIVLYYFLENRVASIFF